MVLGMLFLLSPSIVLLAQAEEEKAIPILSEENLKCLECHGQSTYLYYNDYIERNVKERMNPYFIIEAKAYGESNHASFSCTDCHSYDYNKFPHAGELRMEPKFACIDCHGGDEDYAKYHFEEIDEEFQNSVHSSKHSEEFTCWMCHDPHTYKVEKQEIGSLSERIRYNNEICLNCHSDISKYELLTSVEKPNIMETHSWLPNQALHFETVRCIDCHAEISNDVLVPHNIQEKSMAVKNCVECHSQNSRLLTSLYKLQFQGQQSDNAEMNKAMLGELYLVGANRNSLLNMISIGLFLMVLAGIIIHSILRITIKH